MCTLQYHLAGLIKKDTNGVIQNIFLIWGNPDHTIEPFLEHLDDQLEELNALVNSASKLVSVVVEYLPPTEMEALRTYGRGSSLYTEVSSNPVIVSRGFQMYAAILVKAFKGSTP